MVLAAPSWSRAAEPPKQLVYVKASTVKVCQLTGDFDRQTCKPTLNRTASRVGVAATDLGSSFEHDGRLYFLFGDTWRHANGRDAGVARDVLAWTNSRNPAKIKLDFPCGPGGKWLPLDVPGITHGPFEAPVNGVSIGGKMYVVFATRKGAKNIFGRSVLTVSEDHGKTFRQVYQLSDDKFRVVALWKADPWLYITGIGEYRRSSVRLARVKLDQIRDRNAIVYLAGTDDDDRPKWSHNEDDAVVLFRHDVVGEHSLAYCPTVKRWIILYNSIRPRGITMRSAPNPWGPWSEGHIIFDPWKDKGYGHFMHKLNWRGPSKDGLADPGRKNQWGGEYGPYVMARYMTGDANGCRLFYTMSTWNPYQVVVMRTDLKLEAGPSRKPD
jgi:hypothetical protein